MHLKRIFMNTVGANGASPGSGQAPGTPPAQQQSAPAGGGVPTGSQPQPQSAPTPQAQGAATLPADAIDTIVAKVTDGVFATLRRAGVLKQQPQPKPTTQPGDAGTAAQAAAPTVDVMRMRALDRAVTRAGMADRLDGAAYTRLERAFVEEAPDDVDGWVGGYFRGMGVQQQAAQQQPQPQPQNGAAPQPNNAHPASDRGSPPAPKVAPEDVDLIKMSDADRKALVRDKGLGWYWENLMKQLRGRKVTTR